MALADTQYENLLAKVRNNGRFKSDRTGTGTLNRFGEVLRYDLSQHVHPVVTTKKVYLKGVDTELNWMLRGLTNVDFLNKHNVKIWDANANENEAWLANPNRRGPGDCGAIYGEQWRRWPGQTTLLAADQTPVTDLYHHDLRNDVATAGVIRQHDQIESALYLLRKDPDSRRILVSAWNVGYMDHMSLAPCHALFQFDSEPLTRRERWADPDFIERIQDDPSYWAGPAQEVASIHQNAQLRQDYTPEQLARLDQILDKYNAPRRRLNLALYQRSADLFLGVPFNISSYALLLRLFALHTDHAPGEFVWFGGSVHLYQNHLTQVTEQLARDPYPFPTLKIKKAESLYEQTHELNTYQDYQHYPPIAAPMAV